MIYTLILLVHVVGMFEFVYVCPDGCICDDVAMTCLRKTVPYKPPKNVHIVRLRNVGYLEFLKQNFINGHWKNLTFLDISLESQDYVEEKRAPFTDGSFIGLDHLEFLGIHTHKVMCVFGPIVFLDLDKVKTLDLSDSLWWSVNEIIPSLRSYEDYNILPSLENLTLSELRFLDTKPVDFDADFFNVTTSYRSLKYIDFSDISIGTLDLDHIHKMCETLEYAKLQRVKVSHLKSFYDAKPCKALRILDISGSSFPVSEPDMVVFYLNRDCDAFSLFDNVTHIFYNYIPDVSAPPQWIRSDLKLSLKACGFYNLSRATYRGNKLQALNLTIELSDHLQQNFAELDISDNILKYISPAFLHPTKHLRMLNLSENSLHIMQEKHAADFEILFTESKYLQELYISGNKLTNLPRNIFINNTYLEHIDLSENRMTTVTFDLRGAEKLAFINFKNNWLKVISSPIQELFDKLNSRPAIVFADLNYIGFSTKNKSIRVKSDQNRFTDTGKFQADLSRNDFQCDCDENSIKFLVWVQSSKAVYRSNTTLYTCMLEGETLELFYSALSVTEAFCAHQNLMHFLIIAGTVFLALLATVIIAVILARHRRTKKKKIDRIMLQLKHGNYDKKFLVFLSFCSDDNDFVFNKIFTQLQTSLSQIAQTDKNLVCIGDRDFRPGFPIHTEVISCLEESAVALFVVSETFCQRSWCQMEVGEAYDQGKPIIMLMREHVDINSMPKFLRTVFNRYTRVLWVPDEAGGHVEPEWPHLCKAILELASNGGRFVESEIQ